MNEPMNRIRHLGKQKSLPLAYPLATGALSFLLVAGATALGAHADDQAPSAQTIAGSPLARHALADVTFVAFDTETTGLNPKKDRIVELAAVKYRNGQILEQRTWLVNPGRSIPPWAERIHGISTDMVRDEPPFDRVYEEFAEFIDGAVLVAHNARFDIAFIHEELRRKKLPNPMNEVVDSLRLFRTWFPDLPSHSLQAVAEHMQVGGEEYHRALADSMYVVLILDKGLARFERAARLGDIYADSGGALRF